MTKLKQIQGNPNALRAFLKTLTDRLPERIQLSPPMPEILIKAIGVDPEEIREYWITLGAKKARLQLLIVQNTLSINHIQTAKGSPTLSETEKEEAGRLFVELVLLPGLANKELTGLKLVLIQEDSEN